MQVKDVITQLIKYHNLDDHIMIGYCEFDDVQIDKEDMTQEAWEEACVRADDSEYLFDMEMARIIVSDVENDIKNGALSSWMRIQS